MSRTIIGWYNRMHTAARRMVWLQCLRRVRRSGTPPAGRRMSSAHTGVFGTADWRAGVLAKGRMPPRKAHGRLRAPGMDGMVSLAGARV